jgi:hypothetical protein
MKIYDIIFFFNETEILLKRLDYLSEYTDRTIIYNFGDADLSFLKKDVIEVDLSWENFKKKNFCREILEYIGPKNVTYEDVFIFSKSFEIPSIECLKNIDQQFTQDIQHTKQKSYIFSENLKSLYRHQGSVFTKMHKLFDSDSAHISVLSAEKYDFNSEGYWDCGFSMFCFDNPQKNFESLKFWFGKKLRNLSFDELISCESEGINPFLYQKKHKLIKSYDCPLQIIKNTQEQKVKKILIKLDQFDFDNHTYDYTFTLTYGDTNITDGYLIDYPSKNHYDSDDFLFDYKKNQILVLLKEIFLNDEDLVYIKAKTEDEPSVFEYKVLKNSIPSDII